VPGIPCGGCASGIPCGACSEGDTACFILTWLSASLISEGGIPSFWSCVVISVSDLFCCCISIIRSRVAILRRRLYAFYFFVN